MAFKKIIFQINLELLGPLPYPLHMFLHTPLHPNVFVHLIVETCLYQLPT